jgi:SAM-dependent methyltransferase
MNSAGVGHWAEISQRWAQVGPPLRPSNDDIAVFKRVICDWTAPRALIFGVTPELYCLPWPAQTDLRAVDNTRRMIDNIWPGERDRVVCGDWRSLPFQSGSRDIVLCDGGFHLVSYPQGQMRFVESVRNVLSPGGICAIRLFVPPRAPEEVPIVLEDLLAGKIDHLNFLKLRLGMAMQPDPAVGVRLGDVWSKVDGLGAWPELAVRTGWPLEHLRSLDSYRDSDSRYCFVTPSQVEGIFTRVVGGFVLQSLVYPSYEMGDRCPIIVFRRTN